jgi:heme/copper-type cytochrome/quinol oxidase subunit 4
MQAHDEHDTPMTATYIAVVVVEVVIIVLLWILGRIYS